MLPRGLRSALAASLAVACASGAREAPRPPAPPPPPPPPSAEPCADPASAIDRDAASTLDFHPSRCTLRLSGWYALEMALPDASQVGWFLFCEEQSASGSETSLAIRYRGPPVDDAPLPDLADPYATGGRDATTVSFAFGAPRAPGRYRFEQGEIRFRRPPRALLGLAAGDDTVVEVALDLRFEGDRRFRAALRICPSYADMGPVSDPVR